MLPRKTTDGIQAYSVRADSPHDAKPKLAAGTELSKNHARRLVDLLPHRVAL